MHVKRYFKAMMLSLVGISLLVTAGCGGKTQTQDQSSSPTTAKTAQEEGVNGLTKANPLKVDKAAGTVSFLATVNGKYFFEPTRHAAVFAGGSNGDKAVFKALAQPEPYYNGLVAIGAKAGNNMTFDNMMKTHVAGDALDVTVTWNGANKEYKLDEVIKDSNNKPIDIRFGGNLKNSQDKKTGCLICLDSCPVGISSNSTYTMGAVEKRNEVKFTGNKAVLPADGSLVEVTVKIKK